MIEELESVALELSLACQWHDTCEADVHSIAGRIMFLQANALSVLEMRFATWTHRYSTHHVRPCGALDAKQAVLTC